MLISPELSYVGSLGVAEIRYSGTIVRFEPQTIWESILWVVDTQEVAPDC